MIKSIEKMFNILNLFSMDKTTLALSEIVKETGYPKSTVFRILNTMEKLNYINRNPDNHKYSLGFQFFRLGSIVQNELNFRQVALPIMKKISEKTNETVELNIIDDIYRVCIEKIDSTHNVRNFVRIGERKPLHLGASGKVLLAFTDSKETILNNILKSDPSVNISKLNEELKSIKEDGYCITRGERVTGSFAVAAPVYDFTGKLVASLTIAGPLQRLSDEHLLTIVPILQRSAEELSKQLGYFKVLS